MTSLLLSALTLLTLLGTALVAGTFFAFSTFVMRGLGRLPVPEAIAAMQGINVAVVASPFIAVFVGTGLLGAVVMGAAVLAPEAATARPWLLAAGVLYLVGALVVTGLCNVPRNDALAALDPGAAGDAEAWRTYVSGWMAWNHVRGLAAALATALLAIALRALSLR